MRSTKDLAEWTVPLEVLVTVGTGCAVTRDINQVRELTDFVCRRTVPDHKLQKVSPEVGKRLTKQFPWLKKLKFHKVKDAESAAKWVKKHEAVYGKTFTVKAPDTPIDMGDIFEGLSPEDVKTVSASSLKS